MDEDVDVAELRVVPAKASYDCYAFYQTEGPSGEPIVFWLYHAPEPADRPGDPSEVVDLKKAYKTLLPAAKAALKHAEAHPECGGPKAVTGLRRLVTTLSSRK